MKPIALLVTGAITLVAVTAHASEGAKLTPQELDFFERNIRPVLTEKCYKCHSSQPDAKIKAGLALDTREGLLKGGDSGPSIKAGKPAESLLMKTLHGTDPDLLMPPEKDGGKLPANVIAAFEQWIKMGAPDPRAAKTAASKYGPDSAKAKEHPFFNPVKPVAVPVVKNPKWAKTPVDNFILAKLEANQMTPSGPADKLTLIRRVYFDLIGMPPTPEEVDAFMADKSAKAFEKVVERLLNSPHYGERWGRYWLDIARYGDTMGDTIRNKDNRYLYSYTYRDYVIKAFNEDKPYDQFLVEQIAADRLPLGEDKSALAALGFLSLGNRFNNDANQVIDDRIDVVSRGTMGLTVSCARCHDHKFDPITMKDYYALHGVFNSVTEPAEAPLLKPVPETPEYLEFQKKLAEVEAELAHARATNAHAIITNQHARVGDYLLAIHDFNHSDPNAGLNRNTFFRSKDLDTTLAGNLDRAIKATARKHDPILSPWAQLSALNEKDFSAQAAVLAKKFYANSDEKAKVNPLVARMFLVTPKDMNEVAHRYGRLFADIDRQWQVKLAVKGSNAAGEKMSDPSAEAIRQILYAEGAPLALAERDITRLTSQQTESRENLLIRKLNDVKINHPGSPARAMALQDLPKGRDSAIFMRGNPNSRGPVVPRQFLEIIARPDAQPFQEGSGRLDLARAIANKDNPLTARVMVNRLWHYHFGQGLVSTPSDFGLVGEPPTHPELLDWLAGQFMEHNWSIKHIHRQILLSAAWQQSSDINPKYLTKDQGNALLWRQNRFRLDFEGTRDTLLAVAGSLDRKMGGQPVDLVQDPSPTRRTVYGYINRAALPEFFNTFDFAPPDISSPMRMMTTVPQQALFLMNSPFVIQQAKALAARPELTKTSSTEAKIKTVYRLLYQRPPTPAELKTSVYFINSELARPPEVVEAPAWKYGVGWYDPQSKRVKQFAALGVFEQNKWQAARRIGAVTLDAQGGFTGAGAKQAAIRRWVAPKDAVIHIAGKLTPKDLKSAGVTGRIVSSLKGELGTFTASSTAITTTVDKVEVKKGETIDFVVESLNQKAGLAFTWSPVVALVDREAAETAQEKYEWPAQTDFAGPPPPPLKGMNPWEKYAQVMLLSNELVFVN